MIRFSELQELSYGIPYLYTDFTDVLQNQHSRSYISFLDGINTFTSSNSGIILSGCKILSSGANNYVMSFSNSVVYLNGDIYTNRPSYNTANQNISSGTFYIIGGPTLSETRYLADLTTPVTVSTTRYFEWTTTTPTQSHIRFSNKGTSRRLDRIIKYFTSNVDDVYVNKSLANFDSNGDGFNELEGFKLLNTSSTNLSSKFLVGMVKNDAKFSLRNTGGVNTVTLQTTNLPTHNHETSVAYPFPKFPNGRGQSGYNPLAEDEEGYIVSAADLAQTSYTNSFRPIPLFGLPQTIWKHFHLINTLVSAPDSISLIDKVDEPEPTVDFTQIGSIFARGQLLPYKKEEGLAITPGTPSPPGWGGEYEGNDYYNETPNPGVQFVKTMRFTGGVHDLANSNIQTHKHSITPAYGPGGPHENRPPYYVVVYYTKKEL